MVREEELMEPEQDLLLDIERCYYSNAVRELAKKIGTGHDEYVVRRQLAIAVANGGQGR